MTEGDRSLFTGPYLELTPALLDELRAGIEAHERRYHEDFPRLVEACPYETRLAVACSVMKAIYEHAKEGGSYRYLIYERLGFGPDAYAPCMFSHGLDISNEFILAQASESDQALAACIKKAADAFPPDEEGRQLYTAFLRFEELAAHAARAADIITALRSELHALALSKVEPPRVALP